MRLKAEQGPWVSGIAGVDPFQLYVAYEAEPVEAPGNPPLARFAQPIDLLRASVAPEGQGALRVRLLWSAHGPIAEDYTVFVHLLVNGEVMDQSDGYPASELLPTSWWRPGDQIEDDRIVFLPDDLASGWSVEVGLYKLETLERIAIVDENGQPIADKVQIR
jgi:hypothetical protein